MIFTLFSNFYLLYFLAYFDIVIGSSVYSFACSVSVFRLSLCCFAPLNHLNCAIVITKEFIASFKLYFGYLSNNHCSKLHKRRTCLNDDMRDIYE